MFRRIGASELVAFRLPRGCARGGLALRALALSLALGSFSLSSFSLSSFSLSGCAAADPSAMEDDPASDAMNDVPAAPNPSIAEPLGTVEDDPSLAPPDADSPTPETSEPDVVDRCVAPGGVSNAPTTVLETIDLINALPQPVTLPCFIESLERPLRLYATSGVLSAQPAVGRRSPRLFLFLGPLILSIVPDGPGSRLLEFGELESDTRSLKAEVEFPVVGTQSPEEAFDRIMYNGMMTTCAFCHSSEQQDESFTDARAFVTTALRPSPSERVPLTDLFAEYTLCDAQTEPERCAILGALFDQGDVVDGEFPAAMPTFY